MRLAIVLCLLICGNAFAQVTHPLPTTGGGTGLVAPSRSALKDSLGISSKSILPSQSGQAGRVLGTNGSAVSWVLGGTDSSGVTSIDMAVPSALLTITGNPITSFGTLTVGLATQSSNNVFASPSNGSSGAPLFRSLVAADIPNLPASKINSGTLAIAQGGTNLSSSGASGNYLRSNGSVWTSSAIQVADVPTLNQSTTGSAATLTTPRNINGVAFDGSANITVPAAAGTLTGSTLAGAVTGSSLTSVGTLANLTVTNPISGSVTGTAADLSATLSIAKGGTGQTTANTALNALLPTQTSQSGKFLTTDGTNTSWATAGGGGAVSSVSNLDGTVTVSPTTGAVVVSLPTVAVGTGGTGVTTLATNGVLYGNSSSAIQALAVNATGTNKFLTQSSSGAPAWATIVSGDVPNNAANTTGSAATLTTTRAIYGNNFDGSAALAQIIASTYGGTGNGFTKFSGPATAEKTFTLPNASATVLTDNAAVTVTQGGTGLATITAHDVLVGAGTSNVVPVSPSTSGFVLTSNGTGSDPSFQVLPGANPTATIGTTAVNGSASTFMRSDAAPAFGDLTGDVTSTGMATTIANLAVTNAQIANSTIDLTTKVTGVLPVANGGTGGTIYGLTFVKTTADTGTSSGSLIGSPLQFTIGATDLWEFDVYGQFTSPANGYKLGVLLPAAATMNVFVLAQGATATAMSNSQTIIASNTATTALQTLNGTDGFQLHGWVLAAGTGGAVVIQFSTGTTSTSTLKGGAYIIARRIQ